MYSTVQYSTYVHHSDLKGSMNCSDGIVIKLQAGKMMNQN